ncbi:MAG: MBL fold metallo-hydrolase [Pseudomonadota bacterium]
MRFTVLGSGSRGNATLVEVGATCVLIDCGFSLAELEQRLLRAGKRLWDLTAVLVTHEHGDHVRGVAALARTYRVPIWATPGTARAAKLLGFCREFDCHAPFAVGEMEVNPFPVPHDAREPCQFVVGDGARRLGILTDVGAATPHIVASLSGCDALMLECNHDADMLATGHYPPSLKQRVGGRHGHLSNVQAAALLAELDSGRFQHVVAAHLSEKNNHPRLARRALAEVMDCDDQWIAVADQEQGLEWRDLR